MRDSWIVVSALFASLTVATVAQADDKQACNDAYRQAQVLRNDHKLVEAREQLRVCAGGSCPGFIAKDCSDWLKADESKTPSVVLAAKNPAGADLFDVKVTMDGAPLSSKLDGLAIDVDPGPHTFAFDAPEGHAEQKIVVAEGAEVRRGGRHHDSRRHTFGVFGPYVSRDRAAPRGTSSGRGGKAHFGERAGAERALVRLPDRIRVPRGEHRLPGNWE
jgi:hypothetical protein